MKHHHNQDAPQNITLSIIGLPVPVAIIRATHKHAASALLCAAFFVSRKRQKPTATAVKRPHAGLVVSGAEPGVKE